MKRCPRCGGVINGDVCRRCGGRVVGRWEAPELEVEKQPVSGKQMFKPASRLHHCWVCGLPITPDMLESGEARLIRGHYFCKLHADRRRRAVRALLSSASRQRRWATFLDDDPFDDDSPYKIVSTILIFSFLIVGVVVRTCISLSYKRKEYTDNQQLEPGDLNLAVYCAFVYDVSLKSVRKIDGGLYEAVVGGKVRNLLTHRGLRNVVIKAKILMRGLVAEKSGTVISDSLEGEGLVKAVSPGKTVQWEVAIPVTRDQVRLIKGGKPRVKAKVVYAEW